MDHLQGFVVSLNHEGFSCGSCPGFVVSLSHKGSSCGSSPGFVVSLSHKGFSAVWKRSQPKTTYRSSRSMLAYRCSVSVRALLAKGIGHLSSRRAAPIPIFDASTWMVVGLVTSKYVRAMSLQMEALTFSKTSAWSCSTQMARPSWSELSEGQFGLQAWR